MPHIGVSGHRGLPGQTQKLVDAALREVLVPHTGPELVGVSCLAGGPDQLFARAVLDLGGVLEVVVPAEHHRDGLERQERDGYDELLATAGRIDRLPFVESTPEAPLAAGQTIVDRCDLLIAVWDGQSSRGLGGTADTVAYARDRRVPVTVVWPQGATRES
jgi:hypothetical protein